MESAHAIYGDTMIYDRKKGARIGKYYRDSVRKTFSTLDHPETALEREVSTHYI